MFNKNTSRKVNDRKVLHKVHKNWVVVSFALLMAIGGSALVGQSTTHANADSTNASPKTEFNLSPEIQSEANSLEAPVQMQSVQSTAPSANSANAQPANSSANSSVAYLSGDNGSAASYNQKALNDKASYMPAEQTVNSYVNSLNTRFAPEVNSLKTNINSYTAQNNSDASLASSYSNTAARTNTQSVLASLAASDGMTPNDFANSVKDTKLGYANTVKQGKSLVSEMATVNSYAQLINNIDTNSAASEAYMLSAVSADDAFSIAKAKVDNDKDVLSAMNLNNQNALQSSVAYNKLALADRIALINSDVDATYTNSLASKLGFHNTSDVTNRNIMNIASGFNATNHSATFNFQNAAGSSVPLNVSDQGLYQVLSDANAMDQFGHAQAASAELSTGSMASAYNNLNADNSAEVTASSNAKIADILGNHPTLANLFGAVNTYTVHKQNNANNANTVESAEAALAAQVESAESTEKSANNAVASVEASLGKVNKPTSAQKSVVTAAQSSAAKVDQSADASISQIYSNADKQMNSNIANNATDSIASTVAGNLLDRASYAEASAMINGLNASDINSTASLLNSSLASENATSASYDDMTDANVILAPYYAQSYSADASADAKNVASAKTALNDFYSSHSDQTYEKAFDMAKNSQQNFVKDSVLAYAYGVHVFNHGPKFITMDRNAMLHSSVNFNAENGIQPIHKGTQFQVLGVGFALNGILRYVVNVNGTKGYITARPDFVRATYLPANHKVTVTTLHHVRGYKNNTYNKAVHVYKPGTKLAGTVVSEDNTFGGFTRIHLASGLYVTANTSFVHVDTINVPTPQKVNTQQQKSNQKVNIVNFD